MKEARVALRMMPLEFLRKCEKHYSKEANRDYQDPDDCLFCLEYECPANRCSKCPFDKLKIKEEYAGCEHIRYGNYLKFGRREKDWSLVTTVQTIEFWWRGFMRDLRAMIREKESKRG